MLKCSFCECELPPSLLRRTEPGECPHCGRPIELVPQDSPEAENAFAALILVGVASKKTLELPLGQSLILGREGLGSDFFRDRKFSRKHCLLETNPEAITICDLGSLNGTYVNGERISTKTIIKTTDTITIADEAFTLRLSTAAADLSELPESSCPLHVCVNCGYQDTEGLPRCPECGFGWN